MTSAAKFPGEQRPELQHPSPDCLIGDIQPALGQQILDIAKAGRGLESREETPKEGETIDRTF
jgi:hypothetical protein